MATQSLDKHFETSQENMGNIQWERVVKSNADTVNTHANAIHLNKVISRSPVAVSRIYYPYGMDILVSIRVDAITDWLTEMSSSRVALRTESG